MVTKFLCWGVRLTCLLLLISSCSSNEFANELPISLTESGEITVTEIDKNGGTYEVIVEVAPSYCSVAQIQAVYDSWKELYECDPNQYEKKYYDVPAPHYLIASHPKLTPLIEKMAENNYDGESNQGWIGVTIIMTDPERKESVQGSINEGVLGCFESTEDMSGIKRKVK